MGITADLMYSGKAADAAAEIQQIAKKARSDGEQRNGLFVATSLAVYNGKMKDALASLDQMYAIAQKSTDTLGMIGDLQAKAAIDIEAGKPADALKAFEQVVTLADQSNLPDTIKANIHLFHHNALARVALAQKDLAAARQHADAFVIPALASGNPGQVRQAHELNGMIALAAKQWDTALAELQQASQQNAYNLYRICEAYQGKGEQAKAKDAARRPRSSIRCQSSIFRSYTQRPLKLRASRRGDRWRLRRHRRQISTSTRFSRSSGPPR